jgi:hypothetical protein
MPDLEQPKAVVLGSFPSLCSRTEYRRSIDEFVARHDYEPRLFEQDRRDLLSNVAEERRFHERSTTRSALSQVPYRVVHQARPVIVLFFAPQGAIHSSVFTPFMSPRPRR